MNFEEMKKAVEKWKTDIEKMLSLEENQHINDIVFHFGNKRTKKEVLSTLIYFYLNYALDFKDLTKSELENVYGYFIDEAKEELTDEECDSIKKRMQTLYKIYYSDGTVDKFIKDNREEPPFEID